MRAHGSWRPASNPPVLAAARRSQADGSVEPCLERLPWSTHPSFGAACRNWRSVVAPFYPAWVTPVLLSAADVGSTNLRFYSPYYHKNFEVSRTLEAPGAKFCCAAGRHLTLCQRSKVLEADLVTGDVHELPPSIYGWFHFVVYDGGAEPERMFRN
ncbi:uncharacterized protein [Miscanthus floridulus]|uniref:uncharacterized protein n=1 Tax=Miscanthus floridulus TaxID=154761 RepID=UPI003457E412